MPSTVKSSAGTPAKMAFRRGFAEHSARWMFLISLLFLANMAAIVVLWIDVPRVNEAYREAMLQSLSNGQQLETTAVRAGYGCIAVAGFLWPIFLLELLVNWWSGALSRDEIKEGVIACLLPPLRMGRPNPAMARMIWLPKWGWRQRDDALRKDLEKAFGLPMIIIALMILPILLIEFGMKEQIAERTWLRILLHASTATIWFAFALEFIVMWSAAEKKWQYCRKHWLDLAIILLPLISFLRSLRVVRATQIGRLAKVQQMTKLARAYRLRGLAIKAFRAMLLMEFIDRFRGITPAKRLDRLRDLLAEKEREAVTIRQQIAALEQQLPACDESD